MPTKEYFDPITAANLYRRSKSLYGDQYDPFVNHRPAWGNSRFEFDKTEWKNNKFNWRDENDDYIPPYYNSETSDASSNKLKLLILIIIMMLLVLLFLKR